MAQQPQKTLTQLFVPIALEQLCFILSGVVDTLMLSSVGDQAVGAVGTANTYISIFIIMFNIITSGMIAVMTQYIGAGRVGVAYQARQLGIVFNAIIGVILSLVLFFFSGAILNFVGVAPMLMDYARTYLTIVGGACILNALTPIFSSYLRAFGHTKQPLIATLSANVLNFILNAIFLYFMHWGVRGVATATVISRVVNLVVVIIMGQLLVHAKEDPDRIKNTNVLGQIIRVGLPAACETALYNVAMTLTIRFLNQMDAEGVNVTVRSYANQITSFSCCVGGALAQANAIMTGWRIGAHDFDACDRGTRRAAIVGIVVAVIVEGAFTLSSGLIMRIFTDDPTIISLVGKVLAIDIILEIGRVTNLVYGQALKTSGDAIFPTILAATFMYVFMVGGTYLFGIRLGLMVIGAYIGLASDECIRAVGMCLRWRSGKWREKGFLRQETEVEAN
ncbi:MAG: MATE family efflux transporter [Clostridiales bacterium]|nr:MATE family efflux transporter [Clostridiales bacterium]